MQHCLMASKVHAEAIKKTLSNEQYAASYENVRVCSTCMSSEQQQKQAEQAAAGAGAACVAQKCGGFKNTKTNETKEKETEENARKFPINQPTPIPRQSTDRRISAKCVPEPQRPSQYKLVRHCIPSARSVHWGSVLSRQPKNETLVQLTTHPVDISLQRWCGLGRGAGSRAHAHAPLACGTGRRCFLPRDEELWWPCCSQAWPWHLESRHGASPTHSATINTRAL